MKKEKNFRLDYLTVLVIAVFVLINHKSSAWYWDAEGNNIGGPPWFEHISINMSAYTVQNHDSIYGGDMPEQFRWHNVVVSLDWQSTVVDSIKWKQIAHDVFAVIDSTGQPTGDTVMVADTVNMRSVPLDSRLYPLIIKRNLDTDPDEFYIPGWVGYWDNILYYNSEEPLGLHQIDIVEYDIGLQPRHIFHEDRESNLRSCTYNVQTTASLCLEEGTNWRIYFILGKVNAYFTDSGNHGWLAGAIDNVGYVWDSSDSTDPETFFDTKYPNVPWIESIDINVPNTIIPIRRKIVFDGFFDEDRQSCPGWLPEPNELVGIAMRMKDQQSYYGQFGYTIYDVTTWQGECMNSPVIAEIPRFKPDSVADPEEHWDFEIYNPDKYDVIRINQDVAIPAVHSFPINDSTYGVKSTGAKYSMRGWRLARKDTSRTDTLWLKAKDYAAKAIVSPRNILGKNINIMNKQLDVFGDSIWTISVPTDNDGLHLVGANLGDGMADAWETSMIDTSTLDIQDFLPFFNNSADPYAPTDHPTADRDYILNGRAYKDTTTGAVKPLYGDRLYNFSEYRGFIVCGDDSVLYANPVHKRTDPTLKTVFAHIGGNIADSLHQYFPGYIYKLNISGDSLEVFFTDSVKYHTESEWKYRTYNHYVTLNIAGAKRHYFMHPYWTSLPYRLGNTNELQEAITIWDADFEFYLHRGLFLNEVAITIMDQGAVWGDSNNIAVFYPNGIEQIVIDFSQIETIFFNTCSAYYDSTRYDSLLIHRPWYMRKVVAHEFGHSVGMLHSQNFTLMKTLKLLQTDFGPKIQAGNVGYDTGNFSETAIRKPMGR